MAFSRFYQPVQTQYISQFVPENLELFDSALTNRQKEYDQTAGQIDLFNDALLQQEALPEYDTEVLKGIKGEVDTFASEMSKLDLSLPENKRKVSQFVKQLASDERLGKIQAGVASKKKYDEIKEALIKKNKYVSENDLEFMKSFESYLGQQGDEKKFGVDFIGGKELIPEDAPSRPQLEKFVDNMKASGYTYDKENGTWIDRTSGKGISYDQLMNTLGSNINAFSQTVEGQQMIRRAQMNNVPFEQQFLSEIDPIARERAFKETSNTMRDNTARLDRFRKWKKEDEEKALALVQNGKTDGLFAKFDNFDDYNEEISNLKKSDKPEDQYRAAQMEGQRDILNEKFSKTLTDKEKQVLNYTKEDAIKDGLYKEISSGADVIEDKKSARGVQQQQAISKFEEQTEDLKLKKAKELKAKSLGIDYDKLEEKRDEYISKGEIFESKDYILNISKDSNQARKNISEFAKNSFNSNVLDVVHSTEKDISIENTTSTMIPSSIKMIDNINGPQIFYKYKDEDGDEQSVTVQYKGLGELPQETTDAIYQGLSGGDRALYTNIKYAHEYSGLKPISQNSTYNQKDDIIKHLPQEEAIKFNNFANNAKIINNSDGTVSLNIMSGGKSYTITAPTVAQVMLQLRTQL